MEKVIISSTEVETVEVPTAEPGAKSRLASAIPLWARFAVAPLALVLPILCLVALILRIALRVSMPRTQQAWSRYLNSLLVVSGLLSTFAAVLLFTLSPLPPQAISAGLVDFDARSSFPTLPASANMKGEELAEKMRPLVVIASPSRRSWFSKSDSPSGEIGAALLLAASPAGYLFATARHVADGEGLAKSNGNRVLLTSGQVGWTAAEVVGRSHRLDVALLWVARHYGEGSFVQPLAPANDVKPGESVYVIGHPEGLNFSISNGIVSRTGNEIVQISAPVSPGNSGGPVYNERGELVGVVSFKMDHSYNPNAENLNFAVSAESFTSSAGWDFRENGKQEFENYIKALPRSRPSQPAQGANGHN